MFDRRKVTDGNIKKIVTSVMADQGLVRLFGLYTDPTEDPQCGEYRKSNAWRIVYFFISLAEYVDRTTGLSFNTFAEYAGQVYDEMHDGNYDLHENRCRAIESAKGDFLVRSAQVHEHTLSDVIYIDLGLSHIGEERYTALLEYCKRVIA